jgi:Ca2+-transporting ATPase
MAKAGWHAMEAVQVLKELDTNVQSGLAEDEVQKRIEKYGYNELKKEKGVSPFMLFVNQFKNILIIILLGATVLSALVGEVLDASLILVIVLFCAVLGFVQEYRADKALEALKKMLSPMSTVLRGGKEEKVPSKELVPGDILLLEAGDKIPADARLVENYSLRCDEAPLTGESVPVGKDIKPMPENVRVNDRKNIIFTGTTVTYGRGKAAITATGMNTEFGKIAQEVTSVEVEETPLEKRTKEIGKWLGIIAFSICFLVAGISVVRQGMTGTVDMPFIVTMVMFAVSLAVAAVPEALAAIVTGALAIGMHQMAKNNALVRRMPAVETLGCTTVICSDKTGTLTKGEMTIRKLYSAGKIVEVSGTGYDPVGEFKGADVKKDINLQMLLKGGCLCNDSNLYEKEGKWLIKGDPTEGAFVVTAAKAGLHLREIKLENPRVEEIPFSSERKRMTTIHKMKDGKRVAFIKGAPERVLERCINVSSDSGVKSITAEDKTKILKVNEDMAKDALRVLGVAYRELPDKITCEDENGVESEMVFLGLVGMIDPPREEAIEATRVCKQVGIRPIMITGDHKLTAIAIAKEVGIYKEGDKALTGEELDKIPDEEFERMVDQISVYARVSPMDKLKIVKAWKKRGEVVAMTGDGVNDAPALKHADIGIAMGITGTEVTKEAADMVLSDDNFATIVKAIERGRWIYDNIKKYLAFLIRCNIVEVCVIGGVVLVLGPEYLPLLPAAILYINLATDGLPALALGIAPPDPDIMQRPPRDPKESVFSLDVLTFIITAVLLIVPFFFFIFFHDLNDITQARTEMFYMFILVELVIALNFRSMRYTVLKAPPHKWLVIAVVAQIIMTILILQIPSVKEAFGIGSLLTSDMWIILGFCAFVFLSMEVMKPILRKKMQAAGRRM